MTYNPAGEIVNVTVSVVLGFVSEAAVPLEQEFLVTFVQVESQQRVFYLSLSVIYKMVAFFSTWGRRKEGSLSSAMLQLEWLFKAEAVKQTGVS